MALTAPRSANGKQPILIFLFRRDDAFGTLQRLSEIRDDIVDVFDADRQTDGIRRDAGLELLLGRELLMSRRRRMDDERLRVADIRQQ